ncbi:MULTISPECIES: mechanosensitive ion channel family protein [Brevibacillus]|uniref:mechanosensitive ion channel family protein n=1 Tax=Brevibacillus TaxID=55080 RepID=UPI00203AD4C4|nr:MULTISPECIES: mechanosensitive ion channel family protein [Brevibacillus]MCM3081203.1 mechanosensitive ion channel family protein [Brevibacillus invocatus]MCM3431538.1 mechanosensitive ion channel family protein [Brevibacillus invocatus]MDH4619740.1 mechanosensitive ion channel family protein [Brevibacillus sp. AY1]
MEGKNFFGSLYDKVFEYVTNTDMWIEIGLVVLKIIAIIILSRILVSIVQAAVNQVFRHRQGNKLQMEQRRVDTMRVLVNNVAQYTIYFLALLMVLQQMGIDLRPVLVSAGVLGLAVGFGAQSLVRDVITGFFIIFEDQFAVGDFVTINNMTGTVQEIGLRITRIRSWTGEVFIFPNGTINQVTNFSLANTLAVVDVSVAYEEDLKQVESILKDIMTQVKTELPDVVADPQILGVQALGPSEVVMRITAECKPNTHHGVSRNMRAMIRTEFTKRGIQIPYQKIVAMPSKGQEHAGKEYS